MKKIILLFMITLCSVLTQAQIHTINFPLLLKKVSAAAPSDSVLTIGLDGIVTLVKRTDLLNPALSTKVDKTTTVNGKTLSGNITLVPSDIGLGKVANLTPAELPVSIATQQALNSISLTPGPQGLKGERGDAGLTGTAGLQGLQGIQGEKGDVGSQGIQGPAGSNANVPDADLTVKGKIRLAGDLAGTADAPIVPALADKAPLKGTGTSGVWPISVTGNAATATNWGGVPADFNADVNVISGFPAYDSASSKFKYATKVPIQSFLNINNGSTLNNNVTGDARTWNGQVFLGTHREKNFNFMTSTDQSWGISLLSDVKSALNIDNGSTLYNNINGSSESTITWGGNRYGDISGMDLIGIMGYGNGNYGYVNNPAALKKWMGLTEHAYSTTEYAPIVSPILLGNPRAPTVATQSQSNEIATASFVYNVLSSKIISRSIGVDFPAVIAHGTEFVDIVFPGVTFGDAVSLGVSSTVPDHFISWEARVPREGYVRIILRNTDSNVFDPPFQAFKIVIVK